MLYGRQKLIMPVGSLWLHEHKALATAIAKATRTAQDDPDLSGQVHKGLLVAELGPCHNNHTTHSRHFQWHCAAYLSGVVDREGNKKWG